jgi:DNA-binding NarL/FixJ family response regulator
VIRVVLVEDQAIVRPGLHSLLDLVDDITVVGDAADGEEAKATIPDLAPDVVLLDLRMPKLDGLGVLKQLGAAGMLPPTLVLTTFDDDAGLIDSIRAGARGFLLKDVSLEQLTDAIRTLAAGGTMIQPGITERVLEGLAASPPDFDSQESPEALTDRELEVLRLLAGGYSNREIAKAFGLAEGTVKNHMSSILSKLGVRDRIRAVLKAVDLGLIR